MTDKADCTDFLQWALPQMGFRWSGYRKVRGQVCKRLHRRLEALGLPDLAAYRDRLERDRAEWRVLDGLCRITISRFFRDSGVFQHIADAILPALCRQLQEAGESRLRCLSLGCCGGEEPYTLALVWRFELAPSFPEMAAEIIATDSDPRSLARAAEARYSAGSLKDLPAAWRAAAFDFDDGRYHLRADFRRDVRFLQQDLRAELPPGPFHLVLCRNLIFTYFDQAGQRCIMERLTSQIPSGGVLVLGKHEHLPADIRGFVPVLGHLAIYQRSDEGVDIGVGG